MATTINNVAYSWSMIELQATALGQTSTSSTVLSGVTSVKYKIDRKLETNYGLGGNPVTRGFGNIEYSASMEMDFNTYLNVLGSNDSLINVGEFDLIVSFAGSAVTSSSVTASGTSTWTTKTVTLKKCVFTEDIFEASQDDTSITAEYDLHPFTITIS